MSNNADTGFWRSKLGLVCAASLTIAAFFLITKHTTHVLSALPWLLVAACPLMHLFMHHGHRSHNHGSHADTTRSDADQAQAERR